MSEATSDTVAYYGLWIQTGAIVVSAIGVVLTLFWMNRIARRRASLDIVLSEQTDPRTINERTEFVKLRDAGHLSKWADPANTHTQESATLRAILNQYELVAIGIQQKTMDEKVYKGWCRTTLVKDWIACKALVMQLRENAKVATYYCEFERLAKRWATKDEKPHT
ncbi:DUF4760 domain-containing protein [Stappia indica]|uniref:DUF4760 domain-containing protein n=1 Tax=Stappia indica TaxID=538381 RepID=UPI000BE33AA6|nr:DUF4760 domain-containing protein [Stappia indica]